MRMEKCPLKKCNEKVIEIKENLEKKYNIQLDYNMAYDEFRKISLGFGRMQVNRNNKKKLEGSSLIIFPSTLGRLIE